MDDPAFVSGLERLGDLPRNRQRLVDRDRPARDAVGQRSAVNQLQHERAYVVSGFLVRRSASEGGSRTFLDAVNRRDVRMVQRRQDLGLTLKPRRSGSAANDAGMIFSATSRFSRVSRARYTSPMPPVPRVPASS